MFVSRRLLVCIDIRNDFPGFCKGSIGGGHAGLDSDLHGHLRQLVAREAATGQAGADMECRLFPTAEAGGKRQHK